MISRIDHIAIAVTNLESSLERFIQLLGCDPASIVIEEVPSEKVRVAFIPVGETHIELLQPLGEEGAIAKFVEKSGEGMHHIAFATDNVETEAKRLAENGMEPLSPPKTGAKGKKIFFLHPKQTNRVLVEMAQPGEGGH